MFYIGRWKLRTTYNNATFETIVDTRIWDIGREKTTRHWK